MTEPHSAADRAAAQVEQIVAASQAAAEQMLKEARAEGRELVAAARASAEDELERARKEAILLGEEAKRDADELLTDAKREAEALRSQTDDAVAGRIAAAEKAAAEVLAEARALTGGLRQLGRSLEEQAERILRDVSAAHKRMQADLRVGPSLGSPEPAPARTRPEDRPDREPRSSRGAAARERAASPRRDSPLDQFEVPAWVAPED
jgi:hypothetical protein